MKLIIRSYGIKRVNKKSFLPLAFICKPNLFKSFVAKKAIIIMTTTIEIAMKLSIYFFWC